MQHLADVCAHGLVLLTSGQHHECSSSCSLSGIVSLQSLSVLGVLKFAAVSAVLESKRVSFVWTVFANYFLHSNF